MINLEGPKINSQTMGLKNLDLRAALDELPKVLFEVWATNPEGPASDGSPMTSFDLNKETEKYVKIILQQVEKKYDSGEEVVTETYFPVGKCTEEFFAKTENEKKFWDYNKNKHFNCLQDPEAYMLGTRDNAMLSKDNTFGCT